MPVRKALLVLRLAMVFLFRYSCPTLPPSRRREVNGVMWTERLTNNVLWKARVEGPEAKTVERFW